MNVIRAALAPARLQDADRPDTDLLLLLSMIYALPGVTLESLSQVRRVFTGGSSIRGWAVEKLKSLFSSIQLQQVFGLTKGGTISAATDTEHLDRHLSILVERAGAARSFHVDSISMVDIIRPAKAILERIVDH